MSSMVQNPPKDYVKIPVERDVANELKSHVKVGETYTIIIKRMLDNNKK